MSLNVAGLIGLKLLSDQDLRWLAELTCNQQAWSSILHAGIRSRAYFTALSFRREPTFEPTWADSNASRAADRYFGLTWAYP